jgi:predicted kinase
MNIQKLQDTIDQIKDPFVLLFIGPPLSGKDTVIKNLNLPKNTVILSRDDIAIDMFGAEAYNDTFRRKERVKEIDAALREKIMDAAKANLPAIINMTNMRTNKRKGRLSYFGKGYKKIAVLFPLLNWDEYQRRNEKRKIEQGIDIPEHIIKANLADYQPIMPDEKYDKIIAL